MMMLMSKNQKNGSHQIELLRQRFHRGEIDAQKLLRIVAALDIKNSSKSKLMKALLAHVSK